MGILPSCAIWALMDSTARYAMMSGVVGHLAISSGVLPSASASPGTVGFIDSRSQSARYAAHRSPTACGSESLTWSLPMSMSSDVCRA